MLNDAKNASLYVDWKDRECVSPSEQITDEMLAQITERNQAFLAYAQNGLSMLRRLDKSPEDLRDLVVDFIESAKTLRVEMPDDPVTAGNQLLRQFIDAGLTKLAPKEDEGRRSEIRTKPEGDFL